MKKRKKKEKIPTVERKKNNGYRRLQMGGNGQ